jgi:hypothetical protein
MDVYFLLVSDSMSINAKFPVDDMSKGLKIMSLGVINHSMSFSVQTNFEKTMFVQA